MLAVHISFVEMNKLILLVLCLGWVHGQDQCVTNYAELEDSLLNHPENQYQMAQAFFRPNREIDPVCVITYYYIGVNSSNVVRQNCPTEMITDEEGAAPSGSGVLTHFT